MRAETGPWDASARAVPHSTGSVTLQKRAEDCFGVGRTGMYDTRATELGP